MTPEGKVKAKVKAVLKEFGSDVWAHWPVQTGYGAPTLDCTGSVRNFRTALGIAFAIETKAPGKQLTDQQKATIRSMLRAGTKVFLIGSREGKLAVELAHLRQWLSNHTSP